jgi:hypothetical protein
MMVPSATFYTLLRNYNPLNETISPQFKEIFKNYGSDTLSLFSEHWQAKNSNTPVKSLGAFFAKLDGKLKNIKDPYIIQEWRDHYRSQPPSVKAETLKLLPNPVFLGRSLPSGKVVSPGNIMSEPVAPPFNLPGSKMPVNLVDTGMQLPSYISSNIASASTLAGKLFNNNIKSIVDTVSVSTKAHASNLVPDSKHVERMGKVVAPFLKKVLGSVSDAGGFLLKTMNFNPFGAQNSDISAPRMAIERSVEGQKVVVNSIGQDIAAAALVTNKEFASPKQSNLV